MNTIEKLAVLNCEISEIKDSKYPDAGVTVSGKKYNLLAIKLPYENAEHAMSPSYSFNPNPEILGFSVKEIYADYYGFDEKQCKELDKMGIEKYLDVNDKLDDLLRCAKCHKNYWAQAVKEAIEDADRRKILLLHDLMEAANERNGIVKYGDDDEDDKKEIAENNIKIKSIKKYISDSNFVEHPLDDSAVQGLEKEIG